MNYIEDVARAIFQKVNPGKWMNAEEQRLYRLYALLGFCLQEEVTNADVHDAWSVWQTEINPSHRSLIPFEHLTSEVQELDSEYRDAIIAVVRERGGL